VSGVFVPGIQQLIGDRCGEGGGGVLGDVPPEAMEYLVYMPPPPKVIIFELFILHFTSFALKHL